MRSVQLAGSSSNLFSQLPKIVPASDDKASFFVSWWQRMHKRPFSLVAVALKFVEWADDGAAAQRFVWEVCRWPQGPKGRSSDWTFVCWMIDGVGVWMKPFSSKRAALAYFRQPPAVVMVRSEQPDAEQPTGIAVAEGTLSKKAS